MNNSDERDYAEEAANRREAQASTTITHPGDNVPRCKAVDTYAGGARRAQCRRSATGGDGLCGRHRHDFAPRPPYTCRACGTAGLVGPSTCDEHNPPPAASDA